MRFWTFSLFGLTFLGICGAGPVLLHRELDLEGGCCDLASSSDNGSQLTNIIAYEVKGV